jgi:hypothetical protein
LPPPAFGLGSVDRAAPELGVDGHLFAGHRVEREASAHFGDPLATFGDHDELDDRQNGKNDAADDVVAADYEAPERGDDLTGVRLQQDETRGRHVEREAIQRRDEEQGREGGDFQRVAHVQRDEQDRHRDGEVGRDQQIEQPGRQRHDHQPDDRDHEAGEQSVRDARSRAA